MAGYWHGCNIRDFRQRRDLADAWIDNPASDPFLGPCPGDASNEPLGERPRQERRRAAQRQEFLTRQLFDSKGPLRRAFGVQRVRRTRVLPRARAPRSARSQGRDVVCAWDTSDPARRPPRGLESARLRSGRPPPATPTWCARAGSSTGQSDSDSIGGSCRPCARARSPRTAPALLHCTLLFLKQPRTEPLRAVWRTRAR